jgi:hypothetical protein
MSHAKNVAHCLASGDIVCNLDADQFTGPGFARFLAATFKADKALVVHGDWKARKSLSGRLAVLKEYFMLAGGYDERMQGWGFEELDLIRRLNNLGLEDVLLTEARFLETIDHADEERVRNFPPQFQGMVASHRRNRILSWAHLLTTKANQGVSWGQARIAGVL